MAGDTNFYSAHSNAKENKPTHMGLFKHDNQADPYTAESPPHKNKNNVTSQSDQKMSNGSSHNFFWLKRKKLRSDYSSEEQHRNNNFEDDEVDRLSKGSYDKRHKDKIFIAKNNLKLSLLMNLFLFPCLSLILFFNWYHYKGGTLSVSY